MTAPLHLVRRWIAGEPSPLVAPPGLVVRTLDPGDAGPRGCLLWDGFGAGGPDGFHSAGVAAGEARETLGGKWGPLVRAASLAGVRRRGVGAHLLREAIRRLDRLGVYELHLAVEAGNPARELYARAGLGPA
jgi:GNAT superfamily N-acetyltransferase